MSCSFKQIANLYNFNGFNVTTFKIKMEIPMLRKIYNKYSNQGQVDLEHGSLLNIMITLWHGIAKRDC